MCLFSVLSYSVYIFTFIAFAPLVIGQSYRLSSSVIPVIYELQLTIDLDNLSFNGTEIISVSANESSSIIELHALDLSIDEVQVTLSESEVSIRSTNYVNESQIFRITLSDSLILSAEYKIRLAFRGDIKDDMKGLYRSSYYETGNVK